MTERVLPEHYRSRSRDRSDQRRPTFQVLNAAQPRTHSHGKRDHVTTSHFGPDPSNLPRVEEDYRDSQNIANTLQPHHLQGKIIGIHAVGDKSCESVVSGYRGPACNFASHFHQSNNNANNDCPTTNARNRKPSASPGEVRTLVSSGRHRSSSPEDRLVMDEPSDLMVWNASKKTSRSNLLCPLSDSEYQNMSTLENMTGYPKTCAVKGRSASVPPQVKKSYRKTNTTTRQAGIPGMENRNSVIFVPEQPELLDECLPPMSPIDVSPSVSVASTTYSVLLVSQQLEAITQAQTDILKHLGNEIDKVTEENERLKQEVEHVRDQNEGLLKVVHETSDELERMKHIFRTRGLTHQQPELNKPVTPAEYSEPPAVVLSPTSIQPQHRHRSSKQQPEIHHHGGQRESVNSNNSNKSKKSSMGEGDPAMTQGVADSTYLKQSDGLATKPPKHKRIERKHKKSIQDDVTSLDDLERTDDRQVTDVAGDDLNDDNDNASHRSNDSHGKTSTRRRSGEHHSHHHHHHRQQSPRHSIDSHNETNHRSRSRSKDGHHRGGGEKNAHRTSNCDDDQGENKKMRHKPIYQDDCNDEIEMRQAEGGGCLRVFACCWSSSNSRMRTEDYSVDDLVLRECRE